MPAYSVPARFSMPATATSAWAICGTRSSRTKDTASIRGSPVAARRLTRSARTSGARTSGSFWRPSRGPTSQSVTCTSLASRIHPLGRDLHEHALLVRLQRIVVAVVLVRELVDVLLGPLVRQLRGACDRHPVVRVVAIDDAHAHVRVPPQVARLRAPLGGVDQDMLAVVVDPRRCQLRR